MSPLHPLAQELNDALIRDWPVAHRVLSERGRRIYFPKKGILGQTAEAKGKDINATIGIALENDGTPLHHALFDELIEVPPQEVHPYAPPFGIPEFRKTWQEQIRKKNPSLKAPTSLPVVTSGLTHGLSIAAFLFCDPHDPVLITDLHWDNCELLFEENAGAELVPFRTFHNGGFDHEAFGEALSVGGRGKKIVLLNFPNNPTGFSPTEQDARAIVQALTVEARRGSDIVVLLDDAYFGFFHTENVFRESLIGLLADAHERLLVVKIDGPTKEDCTWGHRIGCLTFAGKGMAGAAATVMEEKAAGVIRSTVSCAAHLPQRLLVRLYRSSDYLQERERMHATLRRRFDITERTLKNPHYRDTFAALPHNSGYFLCVELLNRISGEAVRKLLLEEFSTGLIAFGSLLRIAYSSLPEERIPELFQNIFLACQQLQRKSSVHLPSTCPHGIALAHS